MPELPEVEITRRGIAPYITNCRVRDVVIYNPNLRWRVPRALSRALPGQKIEAVERRAKYLLLQTREGCVIMHLGMSGSLRVVDQKTPLGKHDHVDIRLHNGLCLRFRDPRRFGCILWSRNPGRHRLLRELGPEPLSAEFDGDYLYKVSRSRPGAVKNVLMNTRVVSGLGNIYACEALFAAGIHPHRAANRVGLSRYRRLVLEIQRILASAIKAGGTTLRDFRQADGTPGYFRFSLLVYGRENEACANCGGPIRRVTSHQRSSFYCPACQR